MEPLSVQQLKQQLSQATRQAANDSIHNEVLFNDQFNLYPQKYKENTLTRAIALSAMDMVVVSVLAEENFEGLALGETILPELNSRVQSLAPASQHIKDLYHSLHVAYNFYKEGRALGAINSPLPDLLVAYALLRVCQQLSTNVPPDRVVQVKDLVHRVVGVARDMSKAAKERCQANQQSLLAMANWAIALAVLFQAKVIASAEIEQFKTQLLKHAHAELKAARSTLQAIKADDQESILHLVCRASDDMLSFSPVYIAIASALLNDVGETKAWLDVAKAESSLPPLEYFEHSTDFAKFKQSEWFAQFRPNSATTQTTPPANPMGTNPTPSVAHKPIPLAASILSQSTLSGFVGALFGRPDLSVSVRAAPTQPTTEELIAQAKERLKRRMALYQFRERRAIAGDGNCQFHSLSDQYYGDTDQHYNIRQRIVNWLKSNGDTVLPNGAKLREFVYDGTWEEYCQTMSKLGSWGDHLTLLAFAELWAVRIVIVSSVPDENAFITEIVPERVAPTRHVYLSHYAEMHYSSIEPI